MCLSLWLRGDASPIARATIWPVRAAARPLQHVVDRDVLPLAHLLCACGWLPLRACCGLCSHPLRWGESIARRDACMRKSQHKRAQSLWAFAPPPPRHPRGAGHPGAGGALPLSPPALGSSCRGSPDRLRATPLSTNQHLDHEDGTAARPRGRKDDMAALWRHGGANFLRGAKRHTPPRYQFEIGLLKSLGLSRIMRAAGKPESAFFWNGGVGGDQTMHKGEARMGLPTLGCG